MKWGLVLLWLKDGQYIDPHRKKSTVAYLVAFSDFGPHAYPKMPVFHCVSVALTTQPHGCVKGEVKNNEAKCVTKWPKNHMSLIHFSIIFSDKGHNGPILTWISHRSRINSLNVIFLSCLIIFDLTLKTNQLGDFLARVYNFSEIKNSLTAPKPYYKRLSSKVSCPFLIIDFLQHLPNLQH